MIKLHDYAASANCFKVRLLLAQLGMPYERVPVDIFAGESGTEAFLARNPAGRTPVLELESGDHVAESNAILLHLAEGTPFLPEERLERAQVWQWLFFEQNSLEPNVGGARFWRLTRRDAALPEVFRKRLVDGTAALEALERHLAGRSFLVGDRYTVADIALYGYAHVAHEAGIEMEPYPAIRVWLSRVASQPGAIHDLEPYPPNASV